MTEGMAYSHVRLRDLSGLDFNSFAFRPIEYINHHIQPIRLQRSRNASTCKQTQVRITLGGLRCSS